MPRLNLRYWLEIDSMKDWTTRISEKHKEEIKVVLSIYENPLRRIKTIPKDKVKVVVDGLIWLISTKTFFNEIKPQIERMIKIKLPLDYSVN